MTIHISKRASSQIAQVGRKRTWQVLASISFFTALMVPSGTEAIPVRVQRGLAVRQIQGQMTVLRSSGQSPAAVGDRLSAVGDGLRTGARSSTTLDVDTDVGSLDVTEQTELRIRTLTMAADGGRIMHLNVPRGQVRLRLRPFNHQGSEFEIETPAGITGVRGTEFGITVQDNGKTGIATLSGAVATTAAGSTVTVAEGFQNFTIPGEPPSPPVPLRDDPGLDFRREFLFDNHTRLVVLVGQVDPVNTVFVDGIPQTVDSQGEFRLTRAATSRLRVEVLVVTPLGSQDVHEIYLL